MQQWWRPERFGATPRPARTARAGCSLRCAGFSPRASLSRSTRRHCRRARGWSRICRPSRTELHDPRDGRTARRYLHTSPEFAMKKLLGRRPAADLAARPCVPRRRAKRHAPPGILDARMVSGRRFVARPDRGLRGACCAPARRRPAPWPLSGGAAAPMPGCRGARSASPRRSRSIAGIDILATAPDPLFPDFDLLSTEARRIGIEPHPGDDWEALYFRIFLDRIEPRLGIGAPTILHGFPASMAALSRRNPRKIRDWPSASSSMSAASSSPTLSAN